MRILIAGSSYAPAVNGQAVFTTNLAEGLAQCGHKVLVVLPSDQGHSYRQERNGVQIETVESISLNFLHPDAYFSPLPDRAVKRIFKRFQPQVVHIQDHYTLCRSVVIAAQHRHIKSVGSNHFMPENLAPYVPGASLIEPVYDRVLWQWMMEVYNRVDVATAQSRAAASLIRAQGLHVPVYPISCGIDLNRFHPLPDLDRNLIRQRYGLDPQRKIFLFVGRVDGEKRLDVLLHALALLERNDIQLAIAGRGKAAKELQELAETLQLGQRVHFTGFVPAEDLPALLNAADIFTMPSPAELLSQASLEAMACARPVLLADAVALPELASNYVNGFLFKAGDPQDAAHYINWLADHPDRWPEMGHASLERARSYSLENILGQYESLYETLLTSASQARSSGLRPVRATP
jgi:1,2-diacylglycerol 3-alpha-glucosyltransferase